MSTVESNRLRDSQNCFRWHILIVTMESVAQKREHQIYWQELVKMGFDEEPKNPLPNTPDPTGETLDPHLQPNQSDDTDTFIQRIDAPSSASALNQEHYTPSLTTINAEEDQKLDPAKPKMARQSKTKAGESTGRRIDPIIQSFMLMVTMGVMLLAARFAVPGIVEEIRYAWHRGELRAEYETGTEGLKNVSLDALSEAYQMVTAAVGPSVVHIDVKRSPTTANEQVLALHVPQPSDQGSGAVIDIEGYILTNRHVIADGNEITVTLSDGRRVPAALVGSDSLTDLAVLKVDADGLIPIKWGNSDRCRVGSPVWAVGSPFGLDRTVTFGILSGKHRKVRASTQWQDFMQSDVAVNPGNSGGPLVDSRGTMIGINTAIVGDTYQGVSFSIPSSVAKKVYEGILKTGRMQRGWLGVALTEVPDDLLVGNKPRIRGALVSGIAEGPSPAAAAGITQDDIIVEIDEQEIRDVGHLMRIIGSTTVNSTVNVKVVRDSAELTFAVRLNARPAEFNAP